MPSPDFPACVRDASKNCMFANTTYCGELGDAVLGMVLHTDDPELLRALTGEACSREAGYSLQPVAGEAQ